MTVPTPGVPVDAVDRPLLLVDVTSTACGHQALVWALQEADRRDAGLLAVTVWPGDPTAPDEGRPDMERALEAAVRRAVDETGVHGRTRCLVLTGTATLHDLAECSGAEVVVVGSQEVAS